MSDPATRKLVIEQLAAAMFAGRFDECGGVIFPTSDKPLEPLTGAHLKEAWSWYHCLAAGSGPANLSFLP
jgi:hypothetical protein